MPEMDFLFSFEWSPQMFAGNVGVVMTLLLETLQRSIGVCITSDSCSVAVSADSINQTNSFRSVTSSD